MPRYDYRCEDDTCDTETFEVSKSYSDDSVTECPVCGTAARKLLSPISVHFKGSGFYVTDNRSSNGAAGSGSSLSDWDAVVAAAGSGTLKVASGGPDASAEDLSISRLAADLNIDLEAVVFDTVSERLAAPGAGTADLVIALEAI